MYLGDLIAGRGGPNDTPCTLSDVRMYSGEPDAGGIPAPTRLTAGKPIAGHQTERL